MGALARIASAFRVKAAEGQFRPGPYYLPISGGWLPAGAPWNFWQCGIDPVGGQPNAMVEACVSAYSQTIASLPGDHWRSNAKGGRDRVTTSALSRLLRRPNDYQTASDFLLNAVRSLYLEGNAYALALRNDRFEIDSLHLMSSRQSGAQIAVTGEVFYHLSGNEVIERRLTPPILVPARDVLHVKLQTPRHPLIGESPLAAAAADIAASGQMTAQQFAFYSNQARPSFILSTDQKYDQDQATQIRERWDEHSKGLNAGGTPILTNGLKPIPLTTSAKDAELASILSLTDEHIALVFGVPLQMFGRGATVASSTEELMRRWLAGPLGFALNHVETAFDKLFGLRGVPDEYTEFDTAALLRSAFRDRIEAMARGVISGVYSPNEARAEFELPEVEFGDEPRVQQQVVPLSAASGIPSAPPAPGPEAAPGPATDTPSPEDSADAAKNARALTRRGFRRQVYADAA